MTRARAVLLGAGFDALAGDPARLHPVAGLGAAALALERVAWRPSRRAGAAYAAVVVAGTAAVGALAPGALVVWTVLGGRSLAREAEALAAAVDAGDLDGARRRARSLVGRDVRQLDEAELCRGAIESVSENTADAVVAPLLWFTVAGAAGAAAYRAANTLDAMVGHRSERYERFGWASARLDDVLTWPGARLAAALTVALAPLVAGDARAAARTLARDGRAHPSPNAGLLEAAFAGALGVRLGGVNRYGDRVERRPYLGEGRAPGPTDVRRAVRLSRLVGAAATGLAAWAAAR